MINNHTNDFTKSLNIIKVIKMEYIVHHKDLIGFIAALLGTISFLPQIVKIWKSRSVRDISSAMYLIYVTSGILWLIYGIIIHSAPLIIAEIVTIILVLIILFMKYLWKNGACA